MDEVTLERTVVDGVAVLAPVGELDISTADQLREALADAVAQSPRIAVDLSRTRFLDSMALGAIIGASKRAQQSGGWLRLVAPTPYVLRVLRVTQVDTVLGVYDSAAEAASD